MSKLLTVIALFGCFVSSAANATFYIEPYAGYEQGTLKMQETYTLNGVKKTGEDGASEHGVIYGGRVGLSFLMITLGGEYQGGAPVVNGNTGHTMQDYGPFLQVSIPFVTVRGTYFMGSEWKVKGTSSSVTYSGRGFKGGLGFSFIPFVSVNLEYVSVKYDEAESSKSSLKFQSVDNSRNGVILSLSVPLDL
jgi:hypothetical protein